jgi:hypothetical protein
MFDGSVHPEILALVFEHLPVLQYSQWVQLHY